MRIGERVKLLRENANLTQIELAKILKISNSTLSQYENGVRIPSDDIKIEIANYFDVSIDYLLGRTDIKKNKSAPEDGGGQSKTVRQIMDCVYRMSPKEQEAFLAWLQESQGRG